MWMAESSTHETTMTPRKNSCLRSSRAVWICLGTIAAWLVLLVCIFVPLERLFALHPAKKETTPIPAPIAASIPTATATAAPVAPAPSGKKILILEDDPGIGDIECRMLRNLGYEPVWTMDGAKAIEACEASVKAGTPCAAAILDLTVPDGLGGREILSVLKKLHPDIKTIACSGYSDDDLNAELLAEGFTDILPKPFRAKEIELILKKHLG